MTTEHILHHTDVEAASVEVPSIAIIGGGLTGLFTATLLERAFSQASDNTLIPQMPVPQITVFEKSRSVGRLATRYRTDDHTGKNWQWAFGAQFFTAKTTNFQQFIAPYLESGLIEPWCAQVVDLHPAIVSGQSPDIQQKEQWSSTQARYISTPKMTSWGRVLADELKHTTINFKTCVAPLAHYTQQSLSEESQKTELFDDTGYSLGLFDWVICTVPNAQAIALLANSKFPEPARVTEPKMLACYTLMLGWDSVAQLPDILSHEVQPVWDVAYVNGSIIDRIFIEHQKPKHDNLLPSVTIHARNDWSEQHVDDDIEAVKSQLLTAAQQALNWNEDSRPSQIDCHRWRYAATVKVSNTYSNHDAREGSNKETGVLVDNQQQWIVSGDWCAQGNIESCYQMAQQTVAVICQAT